MTYPGFPPLPAWILGVVSLGVALATHVLIVLMFKRNKLQGRHVFITGGSKGIGLALAKQFVRHGCHVTVIARSQADLAQALQALEALAQELQLSPKLQALSADTGSADELTKALAAAAAGAGPIDVLVCNAGLSIPGLFAAQDMADFQRTVDVNYLGTVRTIKCALPGMLARRQGHIVVVSSMLAVTGFAGYASYAPTKWALRGLSDCLRNELQGTGVAVSVAYPPDTDTPGYATESQTKPTMCIAVNAAVGSQLFDADTVAGVIVRQLQRGAYHLTTPDLGSNMLVSAMTGLSPKSLPLLLGMLLAPILQVISSVVGWLADRAARKCNEKAGYPPRPS